MNTTPVNKQASIFLSRKNRVNTIQEALDRFAEKLIGKEVSENIRQLMALDSQGGRSALIIAITIRRDPKTQSHYHADMKTNLKQEIDQTGYFDLE